MAIYTSYFYNLRYVGDARKIAIARYLPSWINDYPEQRAGLWHFADLGPPDELRVAFKNQEITWLKFREEYLKHLQSRQAQGQLDKLVWLLKPRDWDNFLFCHEKFPSECHRSILAEYLNEHYHFEITEWEKPERQEVKKNGSI